jgi:hypothetical protein
VTTSTGGFEIKGHRAGSGDGHAELQHHRVPTLLHDVRGYPNNAIAVLISGRGVGNWAAFFVLVQFTRVAPRLATTTGMAIQAGPGSGWAISDTEVFWSNLLLGFGQSIAFSRVRLHGLRRRRRAVGWLHAPHAARGVTIHAGTAIIFARCRNHG